MVKLVTSAISFVTSASPAPLAILQVTFSYFEPTTTPDLDVVARSQLAIFKECDEDKAISVDCDTSAVEIVVLICFSKSRKVIVFQLSMTYRLKCEPVLTLTPDVQSLNNARYFQTVFEKITLNTLFRKSLNFLQDRTICLFFRVYQL